MSRKRPSASPRPPLIATAEQGPRGCPYRPRPHLTNDLRDSVTAPMSPFGMMHVVVGRGELTDTAWERIEPLLPRAHGCGRPWRDHRQVVNGVLWRPRTGAPWRDLPQRYGPWQTV